MTEVGTNVSYMIEDGDKLIIEVDLSEEHGLSGSGKTITIASTKGNKAIEDSLTPAMFGLNVYKYPKAKDKGGA